MSGLRNTLAILTTHNAWRRGGDAPQLEPAQIGEAIDHAIAILGQVENLIAQKGRHNTEIAYRGLENAALAAEGANHGGK